jgi:multiple sugar transport system substrate-binding protein
MLGRRRFLGLSLAAAGAAGLTACAGSGSAGSGSQGAQLTMSWWGTPPRNTDTLNALKIIRGQLPKVSFSTLTEGWNNYWTKLASVATSHNLPDVIQMDESYISQYVTQSQLLALDPYISKQIETSTMSSSVVDIGKLNGQQYALPFGVGGWAIIYSKSLFQDAKLTLPPYDWTWDDFATVAGEATKALQTGKYGKARYGTLDFSGDYQLFQIYARQHGQDMFAADGSGLGFESALLEEWFNFWAGLRKSGAASPATVTVAADPTQTPSAEPTGLVGMILGDSNELNTYQAATSHVLGLAMSPGGGSGQPPGRFVRPSMYLSIGASSGHPEEAAQVLNLFMNSSAVWKALTFERGVPASTPVVNTLKPSLSSDDAEQIQFLDYVYKNQTPMNSLPPAGAGDVENQLIKSGQAVASGSSSISAAATQFISEAKNLLAQAG